MLIGRERELSALARLLDGPWTGGDSAAVTGSWGSGKTALLRAVLADLRQDPGTCVVSAVADPLERDLPFGVVRRLFEHLAADDPSAPPLRDRTLDAARVLAPWTQPPGGRAAMTGPDAEVLGDLYRLSVRLAGEKRLLIAVDDLQWADPQSLLWLRYLLRRADHRPLVVLATLGPGAAPAHAAAVAAVEPLFPHRLTLDGLADDAVGALAAQVLGEPPEPPFTAACRAATGGNPLLLHAVLRGLRASGQRPRAELADRITGHVPADLGSAVLLRMQEVDPHAVATAQAVAVLGGAPGTDLITEVTGLPEPAVADAAHRLVGTGWMTGTEHGLSFVCDVLPAAVTAVVLPSRRGDVHLRAARHLLAHEAPLLRVAAHLLLSPLGEPWVPEVLGRAAALAAEQGDDAHAAALLRRALREELTADVRSALLATLGELELTSSLPVAVRNLERSLELSADPAKQTALARKLAGALLALDRHPDALEALRRTSEAVRETAPDHAMRLEIDFIHTSLSEAASAPAVVPRLMELDLSDAAGGPVQRPLAALLSLRAAMAGTSTREVVDLARLALSRGMAPEDDASLVYTGAVTSLGAAGETDLALTYADAAVRAAQAGASAFHHAHALSTRANIYCRLGRLTDCQADAEAALGALGSIGVGPCNGLSTFAITTLAETLLRQGELADAEDLLVRGDLNGRLNGNWIHDYVLMVRGWLRCAQGRLPEGLADFLLCGERTCARSMPNPGFFPWRSEAALVHAALRQGEEARALAQEEVRLARIWGVPEVTGVAVRALGVVVGGRKGLDLLGEAVRLLAGTPARVRYAQALADCGVLARKAGRLSEARAHLRRAVSVAHECSATSLADQALAELRAAGDRPRTRTFHGVGALTPTERRVAELAGRGLTNREIAQRLFVGLRTVEVHLTNVYGKLAIDGRAGLRRALAPHDADPQ
ncbi:helix-turn-helix transcriptional regulator [Streptomyces rhizoryzae]|uniref:helix-turn-helix transcriptional regulator n=1 Tax=Streptomyces rhizoryzae TaxID=2932493 RepID=UPI0027E52034|nr:AAA family ATPase [Streptomyces rhizoryzae]